MLRKPLGLLVTCEHATNFIPKSLDNLGLDAKLLDHHIAWDPGALIIAKEAARILRAPLVEGTVCRLYTDLNRSLDNKTLVITNSFGFPIPGNHRLSDADIAKRVDQFWRPFREESRVHVVDLIARYGCCLHLSVHSFTPRPEGRPPRRQNGGVLYDPERPLEVEVSEEIRTGLCAQGLTIRRNWPYFGTDDGHTTLLKHQIPAEQYLGIELEFSQSLTRDDAKAKTLGVKLAAALEPLVGKPAPRRTAARAR